MHRLQKLYIDLPSVPDGSPRSYGLAVLVVGVATMLRLVLDPVVAGVQFITFFPAVILTTFFTGWKAGSASVVLSALAAWLVVMPPHYSFDVPATRDTISLCLFVVVAAADVLFIGAMKYAIARYRELNDALEERVAERSRELVEAQKQLAHSEKLQAIGQLTGGIAHDFNNMLAIIVGNLDMLKRRMNAGRTDCAELVDHALEGSRRATELTRRLLAYARRQPLAPEVLDINRLAQSVSELLHRTLGGMVSVQCIRAGSLWNAYADSAQLENAIVNLAVNARDAMPAGGTVIIETANASLDEGYASQHTDLKPGQYVVIAVTDSGTGMDSATLQRAVEPFFTTKHDGKGTGLGLSQVFGFLKQSGGHLNIYSEKGKGTTVRMYLPRHYGIAPRVQSGKAPQSAGGTGASVLLVEDDDQVRRMASDALQELGYNVISCSSGKQALLELERNAIDLALTDVVMPEMNGRQFSEEALRLRPELKVIFMTGYTRNAIVHDGMLDPGVELLMKPFTVEELAAKVRSMLTNGSVLAGSKPI
jgi:signal transduction histidine kinase/ActR/RegA family two-component response regulator